jgi:hypothetical protein
MLLLHLLNSLLYYPKLMIAEYETPPRRAALHSKRKWQIWMQLNNDMYFDFLCTSNHPGKNLLEPVNSGGPIEQLSIQVLSNLAYSLCLQYRLDVQRICVTPVHMLEGDCGVVDALGVPNEQIKVYKGKGYSELWQNKQRDGLQSKAPFGGVS